MSAIKIMGVKIFIASFVCRCYLINCRDCLVSNEITCVVSRRGKTITKRRLWNKLFESQFRYERVSGQDYMLPVGPNQFEK